MTEEPGTGETVVRLTGALTIQRSGELREALLLAGEKSGRVVLEFGEFEEADLSFLQLVCSAHREAVRAGWSLSWGPGVPGSFLKSAEDYGFCRARGCSRDKDNSCLWEALRGRNAEGNNVTGKCAAGGRAERKI